MNSVVENVFCYLRNEQLSMSCDTGHIFLAPGAAPLQGGNFAHKSIFTT